MNIPQKPRNTIQIGKSGLTQSSIEEIKKQLKKRKLVSVKFLKSALIDIDRKKLTENILKSVPAILKGSIGNVITLERVLK